MNSKHLLVRAISLFGAAFVFAAHTISVHAGNLAFDGAGNLFLCDQTKTSILKVTPDGTKSTFATGFTSYDMAFDRSGNLFVSVFLSKNHAHAILKFTPEGVKSTFASGLSTIGMPKMAFDGAGNLFVSDYDSHSILKFTPEGAKSAFVSGLEDPTDVAVDGAGNLFVLEEGDRLILKFTPEGTRSTFTTLKERGFSGLICDAAGNLYLADLNYESIVKITPGGVKSTFAPGFRSGDIGFDRSGNLFVHDYESNSIFKITPDGTQTTFASAGISPDKQWEYRLDYSPQIVKAGTTQVALDLAEDLNSRGEDEPVGSRLRQARVVWAPDSKRFAFNYSPPTASHTTYETIALYQLRGGKWVALPSPVNSRSGRPQLAQLAKRHLPKADQSVDVLKVRSWTDADTAILYARSAWAGSGSEAHFLFILKFDAKGNSKIVKTHQMSDEEVDELMRSDQ